MPRTEEGNHLFYFIGEGQCGRKLMPCSEVCMHMQIADQYMDFLVIRSGQTLMVQLFLMPSDNWPASKDRFVHEFSTPITTGEAGLFDAQSHGMDNELPLYYYPHELSCISNEPYANREPYNLGAARQLTRKFAFAD